MFRSFVVRGRRTNIRLLRNPGGWMGSLEGEQLSIVENGFVGCEWDVM